MRIAIAYSRRAKVGGIETYLDNLIPELHHLGHSLAFLHEVNEASEREQIALPNDSPAWCVDELGAEQGLAKLSDWRPDLIFAHGYYGTCISGAKLFKTPSVKPCDRRFGPQCLLHYYPHRCGGLSPITMLREYQRQTKRLETL